MRIHLTRRFWIWAIATLVMLGWGTAFVLAGSPQSVTIRLDFDQHYQPPTAIPDPYDADEFRAGYEAGWREFARSNYMTFSADGVTSGYRQPSVPDVATRSYSYCRGFDQGEFGAALTFKRLWIEAVIEQRSLALTPRTSVNPDVDVQAGWEQETTKFSGRPHGLVFAEVRTSRIIRRLQGESLLQSLENLDRVRDFYYPGQISPSGVPRPRAATSVFFSNRRFIKLYAELRALENPEQQDEYLERYLRKYVSQYNELLSAAQKVNVPRGGRRIYDFPRISDVPGGPPSFKGTALAAQSMALLSGLLGRARLLPLLKEMLSHPLVGREFDRTEWDDIVAQHHECRPLFPEGIAAQVVFQMALNADEAEASKYGLRKAEIMSVIPHEAAEFAEKALASEHRLRTPPFSRAEMLSEVSEIVVPSYQSKVITFDVLYMRFGKPVDWSHGAHRFVLLGPPGYDWTLFREVLKKFPG